MSLWIRTYPLIVLIRAAMLVWLSHVTVVEGAGLLYCKCTCDKESIIKTSKDITSFSTCQDCTRHFCAQQAPSICTTVEPDSITITSECFVRESGKDEAIVLLFLTVTGSLLLYAMIVKPILKRRQNSREARYGAIPSANQ